MLHICNLFTYSNTFWLIWADIFQSANGVFPDVVVVAAGMVEENPPTSRSDSLVVVGASVVEEKPPTSRSEDRKSVG